MSDNLLVLPDTPREEAGVIVERLRAMKAKYRQIGCVDGKGLGVLIEAGQVRKVIASYVGMMIIIFMHATIITLAGLNFVVLHTKGGAVRWFKVSPADSEGSTP